MGKSRKIGEEFLDALPDDGERRLMLAVLMDALRTLRLPRCASDEMAACRAWLRDRAWITSENDKYLFSFVSICHALGLNAEYVRRCVLHRDGRIIRVRRYAERVKESWLRQRRNPGIIPAISFSDCSDAARHRCAPQHNGRVTSLPLAAIRLRAKNQPPVRRSVPLSAREASCAC